MTNAVSYRGKVVAGAGGVVLIHVVLAAARLVDPGVNLAVACVDLFAFWHLVQAHRIGGARRAGFFAAGYACLFVLLVVQGAAPLLFAGFGMLYAACFSVPLLLGYLLILVFSVTVLTPYWLQASILFGVLYAIVVPILPKRIARFQLLCFGIGFLLIFAVLLPLLYLCFQVTPQTLLTNVASQEFRRALLTSVVTATISTVVVVVFGVPLAYALARLEFPGKRVFESLIDLPIVIPQSVAGIAILVLLGPKTPVGEFVKQHLGLEVAGSYLGIIVCQIFVSCPFLVRSAANAFRDMGESIEHVSRTLGASPLSTFWRVTLPLASGGIFTGCILTWARAVSEVGSLMVLAYHPFTVSVYTYDMFIQYGLHEARPAAVLLVIVCLWGFLVLRWLHGLTFGPAFLRTRTHSA